MAKPLNNDETQFIVGISEGTGVDPRVVAAWVYQEGAFRSGGTGGHNYLNVKPAPGDNHAGVSSGGFAQFSNVNDAIKATLTAIYQPQNRIIITEAKTHPTPIEQIRAIAHTPWDQSGYGYGGINLIKTFTGLFTSAGLTDKYQGPETAKSIASTVGTGSAADWTSIDMSIITNPTGAAVGAVGAGLGDIGHALAYPFEWLSNWLGGNWDRLLWVLGGAVLVILGGYMLFKSQTAATA